MFRAEGAVVLAGEPTAAELLAVLERTGAAQVAVLPNSAELAQVAARAAEQAERSGQDVVVVPTASPVQGLAALAVHDPSRRPGDDVVAMAEAAAATRRGEVLVAQREAMTWVGRCQPGDVLGLVDGEVVLIEPGPAEGPGLLAAACQLVDRMVGVGGELVTVLLGHGAGAELGEGLAAHLRHSHPEVEITVYGGGQPDSALLIGVE
ncbi:hypothetical protein KALB_7373 [Kutzneria albida DSM 43870]|uniref:Fatty acid kinase subunit A-like C-terminal domain-containing protein n=1 Tax=Kutzneria albida DSM 43870 TaxID=1449976 RepID=W5WJ22_9PSEU|nr:hypothetical protein KALB_7373 [Kutzneria albida DSM 43870]